MNTGLTSSYQKSLDELAEILLDCQAYSERGGETADSSLDFMLSALYVRICTIGRSIQSYLPKFTGLDSHWDYASVGSIVRNLIDALNSFLYLSEVYLPESNLSDSESECRLLIFELHDAVTRRKVFEFRGGGEKINDCKVRANEVIQELESNEFFKSLPQSRRKHFLKGTDPFLIQKEEIIQRNGGDRDHFLGLYKFLSAHAHSYPMGYFNMHENDCGRGIHCDMEEEYMEMMAQLTSQHLLAARNVYGFVK